MPHALAVSAFPEVHNRSSPAPTKVTRLTVDPMAKRGRGEANAVLLPGSVEQSWKGAQLDDDDLESPISPMIFRTVDLPGRYLDQDVDRSLPHSSASAPLTAWHSGAQQVVSTKASIAALGLSRHSPTPNYDLLSTSTWLNPQRGSLNQHIPPRSSSLPSSHRISICASSYTMSRSTTPSSIDSDCCSEMMFAEPNPHDAEYGSAPKPSVETCSLTPNPHPRPHALNSSTPPRPPSSFLSYHSSTISHPHSDPEDFEPYSLMGAGPGFAASFVPARLPKVKPKPKASAPSDSISNSPSDSSLGFGFKRMKRLATRRSISSFDFLSSGEDGGQNTSTVASALSSERGQSSETIVSAVVNTPSGGEGDGGKVFALVGDVWEQQNLGQVIPALRSLKVSGKIGH